MTPHGSIEKMHEIGGKIW